MSVKDWALENVDAAHARAPDSFFIPSLEERRALRPGDIVKLIFLLTNQSTANVPRAERMWVRIDSVRGDQFTGRLDNIPKYLQTLAADDQIAFNVEHIAQIVIKRGHPLWCDCAEQKALVSEAALATESSARWIYREPPDNPDDSGWRVFEGSEDDAFANDARNIRLVTVGWLIDRDPTLAAVFREEHGKACERATLSSPWRAVPPPPEQ